MKLNNQIAIMGAGSVLLTAVALVLLAVWQSKEYNTLAQEEVNLLIDSDLNHITQGIYNLVRTENEAVQQQMDSNLKVARHILDSAGKIELGHELVNWVAINQFTNTSKPVRLPKLLISGKWLQKNKSFKQQTPVVDKVSALVGETATIFQRINEKGDMLRVATTVQTGTGERAISTYIPAINPNGNNNPVVTAVLRGETYHGRAYVVNDWYLTTYEPIRDGDGNVMGMLYVGVKQQAVAARIRNAILQTSVGKTGYVYVISGRGADRGRYVISRKGERDGEDIWSSRDLDNRPIIQDIIFKATQLEPGGMATVRYRWQNPGDPEPRWKIARLAYYAPWDWVIGTSVYEDELQSYSNQLTSGRMRMIRSMCIAGSLIAVIIALIAMYAVWVILRPVREMTAIAQKIIDGDHSQIVEVRSKDEIGILARTFNQMSTELHQAISSLKESEEKYRNIFEYALEGLFQSTLEGRFISANPAAAKMLGYDSPEELIGEISDIQTQFYVNPSDRAMLLDSISNNQEISSFEVQCYRKNGQKIWVAISARMPRSVAREEQLIYGFIRDITEQRKAETERKNLESKLIQSQKMEAIGTLAGGIAHDFNNILQPILSYNELLKSELSGNSTCEKYVSRINTAALRAKDLVSQILAFSRQSSEQSTSPVQIKSSLEEIIKLCRATIPSSINIVEDIQHDCSSVLVNPSHLHQIAMNLIINAYHAVELNGGQIMIELHEVFLDTLDVAGMALLPAKYVKMAVSDTGCGINPDVIDKIFDPYFTTKGQGKGTGLGLSVVYGIVQENLGDMKVCSEVGKGTTFTVYLPIVESPYKKTAIAQSPISFSSGNEHILLVDDEDLILEVEEMQLKALGYRVTIQNSSLNALKLFRLNPGEFDLVITDLSMPNMTGVQLAEEFLKIRPDIPLIICSGLNEKNNQEKAKLVGVTRFMAKPITFSELSQQVSIALEGK